MKSKIKFDIWVIIGAIIVVLLLIFLIAPLSNLMIGAFKDPETNAVSLRNFVRFFSKPYYYNSLLNSIKVTSLVTALSVIIGLPMAYFMTIYNIKGKKFIEVLIIISMMSPPFIGAYSWIVLLGRNGIISNLLRGYIDFGSIYGFGGITLVFVMKLYPYMYMYIKGALTKIDASLLEAAENLGCSSFKKIYTIIIPLILPTIFAGAMIIFANAFSDFGTPMMIGEGFRTMPVLVYTEYVGEIGGSANFASAISVIMVLITISIFALQKYITSKKSYAMSSLRPLQVKKITGIKSLIIHLFVYTITIISVMPQVCVFMTSFQDNLGIFSNNSWTFNNYKEAINKVGYTIVNTYTYAFVAIVIVMIIGVSIAFISERRKSFVSSIIDSVTMLPMIISGTIFGIMMLLTFNHKPLLLSGTATILIVAFVVRRMPYTIRSSAAILRQLNPSMEEAAISLGSSPTVTFFKITCPLMMGGVFSGLVLSWITIIQELSSSVILYTGRTTTMSVSVYSEVTRNNFGIASALASILMVTVVISIVVFLKFSGKKGLSL